MCVGFGKNIGYEKPYTVIGGIKRTGLKDKPKDICKDRIIGTRKGIGVLSKNIANEENKLLNQC